MSGWDRLSEMLRAVKAPMAPPELAAGVLVRLLTGEAEPDRRRQLVRTLGASVYRVETGVAYTFEVVVARGRDVALPDAARHRRVPRGSPRRVFHDHRHMPVGRAALVGVGYTFLLEDLGGMAS